MMCCMRGVFLVSALEALTTFLVLPEVSNSDRSSCRTNLLMLLAKIMYCIGNGKYQEDLSVRRRGRVLEMIVTSWCTCWCLVEIDRMAVSVSL